jgi:hypothetical protein
MARNDAVKLANAELHKKENEADAEAARQKIDIAEKTARQIMELGRRVAQTELQTAKEEAAAEAEVEKAKENSELSAIRDALNLGVITKKQAILQEIEADNKALDAKLAAIKKAADAQIAADQKELDAAKAAAAVQANAGVQKGDPGYIDYLQQVDALQAKIDATTRKAAADSTAATIQNVTAIHSLKSALQGTESSWKTYFDKMKTETKDLGTQIRVQLQDSIKKFEDAFAHAVAKSIVEGKSLGAAMKGVAQQIGEDMIAMLLKVLEEWVISHTILGALETKAAAKTIAKNKLVQASEAGVAAAYAYESVMAALPFPANVATAPGVAAETFAAAMAFEKGGIVPETAMAMVHKNEMVLPADLAQGMQDLIRKGGPSGGNTYHTWQIDARGADVAAVQRLEKLVERSKREAVGMAVALTRDRNRRQIA